MIYKKLPLSIFFILTVTLGFSQSSLDRWPHVIPYLSKHKADLKIEDRDVQTFTVNHEYLDKSSGIQYIYLDQVINNIPIKNASLSIGLDKNGYVAYVGNAAIPNLSKVQIIDHQSIDIPTATIIAAEYLGIDRPEKPISGQRTNNGFIKLNQTSYTKSPILAKQIYEYAEGKLFLAHEITLDLANSSDYMNVSVSTEGKILRKENLTIYCQHHEGQWSHNDNCTHQNNTGSEKNSSVQILETLPPLMATPSYRVYPLPTESPIHGSLQLVRNPINTTASPEGWHRIDGRVNNTTRGNNATVFLDEDDNDVQDSGTGLNPLDSLLFDYPHNITQDPALFKAASQVNLFYVINMMHDLMFFYGFDEAAGNFQARNFTQNSGANDQVIGQTFDGFKLNSEDKLNNANFVTPIDGTSGKMQMYLFNRSSGAIKITAPEAEARSIDQYGTAAFGGLIPASTATPIIANPVVGLTSSLNNPREGCQSIITNLTGKIALIDRGNCDFSLKAFYAQQAGAVACFVCNIAGVNGGNGEELLTMSAGANATQVTIPTLFLRKSDCDRLKGLLTRGVVPTIRIQENPLSGPAFYDGSFDNGVIAHEFGHGISNRLTGGPNNSSCLGNFEQMGEGWSDFFALITTVKPGDKGDKTRGVGTFLSNEPTDGVGFRRFPYSTDMNINPLTYDDIKGPELDSRGRARPHSVGEVWNAMLWDLYWAMADRYGFDPNLLNTDSGNGRAIRLVMTGMKLQACRPGFIEGRNAILAADRVLFNGQNECIIWEAFARRGLGFNAFGGSTNNRNDGIEDFETMPTCIKKLKITKTMQPTANAGEIIDVRLTAINHIPSSVTNVLVEDDLLVGAELVAGSSNFPVTVVNGKLRFSLGTMVFDESKVINYKLKLPSTRSQILQKYDIDSGIDGFDIEVRNGFDTWQVVNTNANSGKDAYFIFGSKLSNDHSLITPSLKVTSKKALFKFSHRYDIQPIFDGGYLSISTDNGSSWQSLVGKFLVNGPTQDIDYSTFAIPDLKGFSGSTGGKYIDSYVDLSSFEGKNVKIRFRYGSDTTGVVNNAGWWIDDLELLDGATSVTIACIDDDKKDKLNCSPSKLLIYKSNTSTSTKIETLNATTVNLFPNPSSDRLYLSYDTPQSHSLTYSIYSLDGKRLSKNVKDVSSGSNILSIDTSLLAEGIYLIECIGLDKRMTKKFIISK